ncbi:sodium- and chloride-dependent glycine transporter 2-like isoform X1 [Argiope bruennichi]|uniref:sodium- and chloride-dependent glycine transporter 2-like isoform X1 n=1 Tax=Argiope bruennichi TaxID=94029 RepID=UPI00249412CD|nr:sodium- and chloride-dependent glycine transporter 2-like isoform X1 [Argiope bruennichi]
MDTRRVSFHQKSLTSKILDGRRDDSIDNLAQVPRRKPKPPLERQFSCQSRSSLRRASVIGNRKGSASIRKLSTYTIASRGNWGSKWEFLLSCVGLSVGIGNVWRFPYLAYEHGGGAFLIPYLLMLLLAGKPLYFMELAFGQFAGLGPLAIWNCLPIAKGIGYAMVTISLVICIYYNVIVCYTVFYIASTFQTTVPWASCPSYPENTTKCHVRTEGDNMSHVGSKLSSEIYWENYVLNLSEGIEDPGGIKWDLSLCLLFSWIVVIACLLQGIKTSGKVVYFAATFPYIVLIILLITGLLQEGAVNGILYFISPNWKKLLDIKVWQAAAGQMFFSLGVSMGALIMYSSYNDFRNNIFRDAMVVSVLDTVTSIISGMVIFSVLGAMAHDLGPGTSVEDVVASGPGLAFMAYPEALSRLPMPQLWSILFFFMLFILGLDSEFALMENVLTSFCDEYPHLRNHKSKLCIMLGIMCFLLGLPCTTRGGQYILEMMDKYGGGTAVVCVAVIESMAIAWMYGVTRFCEDIKFMLGKKPGIYWRITWKITAPAILTFVFVYSLVEHETLKYGSYDFPDWADAVGWGLASLSMLQIPFWAVLAVWNQRGTTLKEKFKLAIKPNEEWGPSDELIRDFYKAQMDNTAPSSESTSVRYLARNSNESGILEYL